MKTVNCRFVIVGSGGSSSLPNLRHVLQKEAGCKVCQEASTNPESKNRRGNPCMLVTVRNSEPQHLLVDCGKTFEEAVRQHFARLGVQGVNAVLLTHGHADAILGLDSLREVQLAREPPSQWKLKAKTPIIATNDTVKEVWSHFHYLLPENSGEPTLRRRTSCSRSVSGLSPMRVTDFQNLQAIPGLQVQTVPVLHGGTYESSGFRFGARGEFVYLSDVSKVPDDTMKVLKSHRAEVLVVDALLKSGPNYSHYGLPQALDLIRELRPKRALLIGMSCEFDHYQDNQQLFQLRSEGLQVELSYDGLELEVPLTLDPEVPLLELQDYELQLAQIPKPTNGVWQGLCTCCPLLARAY
ncbi:unnamed protein product [Effrenium voratum]|nr:unnamed protein product [Effrenium voratum]